MPDLKIEWVARNELGAIVSLITPHGVVDARTASEQIARGDASYVTGPDSFVRVPVRSISAMGGAYLYANWDGSQRNNLNDVAAVRVQTWSTNPAEASTSPRAGAGTLWNQLVKRIRMLAPTRTAPCVDCAQGC